MRRRRRPPTRTTKRNNTFDPNSAFKRKQENGKSKKILKIALWIIIVGLISYYAYNHWYLPDTRSETVTLDSMSAESTVIRKDSVNTPVFKQPEKMIQIEVLNGCGKSGIAKIFKSYLRQQGFDVVNTENYRIMGKINWNVPHSKVMDQIGKIEFAEAVANSLGIDEKYVSSIDNPSPVYDVTVVIGKDFDKLKGFKEFSK